VVVFNTLIDLEETYKYLGVHESDGVKHDGFVMKTQLITTYRQRIRKTLHSHLNNKNVIQAMNIYAVPLVRYSAGLSSGDVQTDKKTLNFASSV